MANPGAPDDSIGNLQDIIDGIRQQIRELATFDGTQNTRAIEKLQMLIDELPAQVFAVLAVAVNTGNVTATGFGHFGSDVSAGAAITAQGAVSGSSGSFPVGVTSLGARSTTLTNGFANFYIDSAGRMGIVPSSIWVKQDIHAADTRDEVAAIFRMPIVDYRYIAAVEEHGDAARVERGSIAEYVELIGLGRYVSRDADGEVDGINYERLTIPLIAAVQSLDARLRALEERAI